MVHPSTSMTVCIFNDGGRSLAHSQAITEGNAKDEKYFSGSADDCVIRSLAIITGHPYKDIWHACKAMMRRGWITDTPNHGVIVNDPEFKAYAQGLGLSWVPLESPYPTFNNAPLPAKCVALIKQHAVAVIDGQMHDTYNATPSGRAYVRGYFVPVVKADMYNVCNAATGLPLNRAPLNYGQAETMARLLLLNYKIKTKLNPHGN